MAESVRGFCTSLAVVSILTLSLGVSGCGSLSSMGESVGHSVASRTLAKHVGQPYTAIQSDSKHGKLIGEEKLANGMVVKKHLHDKTGGDAIIDNSRQGIGFQEKKKMATYFLVDKNGVVQDWAFGYVSAGTGFSLGMFSVTEAFKSKDTAVNISEVDSVVRTKNDEPYTVWKRLQG